MVAQNGPSSPISWGSAVEVQSQLKIALAAGRLTLRQYYALRALADRSVALITKLHAVVVTQADPE